MDKTFNINFECLEKILYSYNDYTYSPEFKSLKKNLQFHLQYL